MFNSLFDVLPAHIEDWVDTHDIVATLFGTHGTDSALVKFFIVMDDAGTHILPEGMLNVNAMLIMFTCFVFAWISGNMKPITSMVVGTLFASVALFASGASTLGWVSLGAIAIFSVGEMLSSPKFSEYIGNFAPADKKGMYLGFSQISLAIGWTLEGAVGPRLYDHFASKDAFSRQALAERGWAADAIAGIPQGEAFDKLTEVVGRHPQEVTRMLLEQHSPGTVWWIMGAIGVVSAVGIAWYGRWVKSLRR